MERNSVTEKLDSLEGNNLMENTAKDRVNNYNYITIKSLKNLW